MHRSPAVVRLLLVALVLIVTAGCSESSSDAAPAPFALTPSLALAAPLGVPTAGPCSPGFGELELTPETATEQWLAPSLRACARVGGNLSDGTRRVEVEAVNAGPAVWVVDNVSGWLDSALGEGPLGVQLFRAATRDRYAGLALEPGQRVYIQVGPDFLLRLHLDGGLQTAWETVMRGLTAAQNRLQSALDRRSSTASALVTCGLAGYQVSQQLAANTPTDPTTALDYALTAAAAAPPCVDALDRAAITEGRSAGPLVRRSDYTAAAIDNAAAARRSGSAVITALERGVSMLGRI